MNASQIGCRYYTGSSVPKNTIAFLYETICITDMLNHLIGYYLIKALILEREPPINVSKNHIYSFFIRS